MITIKSSYEVEELEKEATRRNFRQVRQEGKRMVNRTMTMYNLDMIISVGYRGTLSQCGGESCHVAVFGDEKPLV